MQYGVCGVPHVAACAAQAAFDFAEWSVGALLKPREPQHEFLAALEEVRAAKLPYPVLNCFVPGDLKITGPHVNDSELRKYVTTAFERAELARVEVIVFGSGGARRIPEGFDPKDAHDQLVRFCSMLAPIAWRHGVTVVVEPLNRQECNVLTTVKECAALVREVAQPGLRLLVDAYHLLRDNDSHEDIVAHGDLLAHVHIATVPNRLAPGAEPCDFAPFFAALAKAGYNGRVSIEGTIPDAEKDLTTALSLMSRLTIRALQCKVDARQTVGEKPRRDPPLNRPQTVGLQIERQPDFDQFLKILKRQGKPDHLPFYEHVANPAFISRRLGLDITALRGKKEYWHRFTDFWLSLGFDCIPLEIPFSFGKIEKRRPAGLPNYHSEADACIFSMADFERFPWPDVERPINFEPFEIVAEYMPAGVKIAGGVGTGPYENATLRLLGVMGLSFALADQPELVTAVFDRLKALYVSANRQLAAMEAVGACRQGDDLGFKTATFLPPDTLRRYVFPIYREMVNAAHAQGKPFILHSCGYLQDVYEDLIACGIDAKHSFEDQILPVWEFQKRYGDRITPLGGLDVDVVCRSSEQDLRAYTRKVIEKCLEDGRHWALGTGNSLPEYMPVENYLITLDEAIRVTGG